jgi:nitroreductase
MNTLDAIRSKRAVRHFTDRPVEEEVIRKILEAGRWAQSSKNTQPWTFIVVRDKERLKNLSECGTWAGHMAGAAFAVAIAANTPWSFDIGQASANMQLAAWDLGIGSCLVYFQKPDEARSLLGVPDEYALEIGISFGYPDKSPRPIGLRPGRKKFTEVVKWEKM